MTKIDIISGFLGAGKTTLIKKLLSEALKGEQVVLIENEFGEIGIDGGFLKDSGIEIREMNSGCICCSLVGDFGTSLKEVITTYHPDRIIIEPSGVGKLSDVIKAVKGVDVDCEISLNSYTTVADVNKCKMYMRNFGEFFENQLQYARTIILSRTDTPKATEEKVAKAVALIREVNKDAVIITTPIEKLDGAQILEAMEQGREEDEDFCPVCGGHHDHDHEHEHHHHDHDDECGCDHDHEHEHHHHDHDGECGCDHDHEHEHHHHDHDHDHEGGEVEEYGIGTFVYYRRKPFDLGLFDDFVARKWPRDVVRAKGICYFDDERDMCYVFEQAGKQKTVKQAGQWLATMPKGELAQVLLNNPQLQKEWDQELGDRMIKIVFIGQHIKEQKDAIIAELDKCLA